MNFKNLAENLIIVIVSVFVGGYVGFKASTSSNKQSITLLTPTIIEAIKKETIKNEISHEIDVKIDKIKKSDSLKIELIQTPTTKQEPINNINDCKPPKGMVLVKIESLNRRQRKRLGF